MAITSTEGASDQAVLRKHLDKWQRDRENCIIRRSAEIAGAMGGLSSRHWTWKLHIKL
jgi:hypothetical protein